MVKRSFGRKKKVKTHKEQKDKAGMEVKIETEEKHVEVEDKASEINASDAKKAGKQEKDKKGREVPITDENGSDVADNQSFEAEVVGEDVDSMKGELEEVKNQLLRMQADYSNLRKRTEREIADSIRFAKEDLVKIMLPMLDDFGRTLKAIDTTDNLSAIKDGIKLVNNNVNRIFSKIGVEPIESIGQEFDSELHEAITSVPVEDEAMKGKVVDEVEKGYKLRDRVVRFSKVVVGE